MPRRNSKPMNIERESSWKKRFKIGKLLKLKLSLRLRIR
jgi:hypothetical protein